MGFFKRRAKHSAPGHPDSSAQTAANEMTTLESVDADGLDRSGGEAVSGSGPEAPRPDEFLLAEEAARLTPEPEASPTEEITRLSPDPDDASPEEAALLGPADDSALTEPDDSALDPDPSEENLYLNTPDEDEPPKTTAKAPLVPGLPINEDSFATKEDWLLAFIEYAAPPPGIRKNPPAEGETRVADNLAPTEQADGYFGGGPVGADQAQDRPPAAPEAAGAGGEAGPTEASPDDSSCVGPLRDLAPAPSDEELDSLRRLILGREIDGLEDIHHQLSDHRRQAEALSQVVAEAIRLRARQDDQMIVALKGTVDQIVRSSVRNNPADLADNLFPVMGPAIRRSISESIRGMLQDFSRTLEKSFSLTGLKWRFEAARTGKKFSEVVMLKTIEYQVEQVLFVHTATGLRLVHLYHENALHTDDGDQVSAMLTVMQQFVNDSFAEGELSTVEFGEFNIYIARAPQAYLACVVRGQAPSDLRTDMQIALEQMIMECADELDAFDGNAEPFKKVAHYAEALLSSRYKDEGRKLSLAARLLPVMLILVILGALGFWGYKKYETDRLEKMIYQAVNKTGVIPLHIAPSLFGLWEITVLQDELADSLPYESNRPIADQIVAGGLPRDRFVINAQPFVSQDIEIVIERVRSFLKDAPQGVNKEPNPMELGARRVPLEGTATIPWALSAYEHLISVPGVKQVNVHISDPDKGLTLVIEDRRLSLKGRASLVPWVFSMYERLINTIGVDSVELNVQDSDNGVSAFIDNQVLTFKGQASLGWQTAVSENAMIVSAGRLVDLSGIEDDADTRELKTLRDRINRVVILFPLGKDQPAQEDAQQLNQAVNDLVELEKLADSMGMSVSLTIYGHADATGSDTRNYDLSQARTKTVAARLYARGSAIPIAGYGLGSEFAARAGGEVKVSDDQASRKIELRVELSKKPVALHK